MNHFSQPSNVPHSLSSQAAAFFGNDCTIIHTSSPGRMDVMGGIADYSGSLLLQMPLAQRTTVQLAPREDGYVRVRSQAALEAGLPGEVCVPLTDFLFEKSEEDARQAITRLPGGTWAIYVLGCFYHLYHHQPFGFRGADVLVESAVPFGKGVSSSAAVEVATMMAIDQAYHLGLGRLALPILAQQVENRLVGAPCGLMDQLASYLGEAYRLLPIVCQPAQVFPAIPIPASLHLVGIDSGVRHAVSDDAYGRVRVAAFMGYTILARALGVSVQDLEEARVSQRWEHLPLGGYLANISVRDWEDKYQAWLPETISGRAFLDTYHTLIDSVTSISPDTWYAVRACAAHPVYENARVRRFKQLFETLATYPDTAYPSELLTEAGHLMYASHQSYTQCGLGHACTDQLVEMVQAAGPTQGLYGAKITGGGSGGTVCVLAVGADGLQAARAIAAQYNQGRGTLGVFFEESSPGGFYTDRTG